MLIAVLDDGCEIFSSNTAIFIEAAQHHTYADASLVRGSLCCAPDAAAICCRSCGDGRWW
jgi:hypothetical protein